MKRLGLMLLGLVALGTSGVAAKVPGAADPYRHDETDPATIRLWGNPAMERLFGLWEEGYRRNHPEIRFEHRLVSTAMAMPGIYLGIADLAVMGREPDVEDHDGFAHVRAYEPWRLEVATGSLATPGKSPALAAFVAASNPLRRLTLSQLDGAFGWEHRRGPRPLVTWGDLGLKGAWAARPVHLYAPDLDSGTGQYFLQRVLLGSRKLYWDRLEEVPDDASRLQRLRSDPDGLAVASLAAVPGGVRCLALGDEHAGGYFLPTPETLIAGQYPLTRTALVFVNRPPGAPIDSKVARFLRYIYSPEGQAILRGEGQYLPLSPRALDAGRARVSLGTDGAGAVVPGDREVRSLRLKLIWVAPGSFDMGSPPSEPGHGRAESPLTHVTLTRGYWLGAWSVTQGQWQALMGTTVVDQARAALQDDSPILLGGKRRVPIRTFFGMSKTDDVMRLVGNEALDIPITWVSWNEATEFCRRLNAAEKEAGRLPDGYEYRLPTEAEWEYAARAGTSDATYNGPIDSAANVDSPALDPIAWYAGNSAAGYTGHAIDTGTWPDQKEGLAGKAGPRLSGTRRPNAWGFYDLLGNVAQWCRDWNGTYPGGNVTDWTGPASGTMHPRRGGSWSSFAPHSRLGFRQFHEAGYRFINLGFRVALAPICP